MNTLLDWLLARYPDTPRTRAKQWIAAGRVSVAGVVIRQPHKQLPDPGNTLALLDRNTISLNCGPNGMAIHEKLILLHLDSSLAIVNKAAGLLSVPAPTGEISAQDILAAKLRTLPPVYRRLEALVVHRIDFYTSGLFCMAMNPSARANLIEQVSEHTMQREYIAFVEGRPRQPKGTWRDWLKLNQDETEQTIVTASTDDAMESITHYEVVAEFPRAGVVKLRLRLETGRRHQIRVQATHAGLPLVGDRKYNRHPRLRFPRQALHATSLALTHPELNRRMTFTAPLPDDLRRLEDMLKPSRT
ncbi:MAG: RluA family pseudouridine synthase [Verrucomicrobia bacterium]|nr:RluA family pseudouridine synthase [Verrucomicrobiota bacterium]